MGKIIDDSIKIDNTEIQYVAFGKGSENLVMIPGLGDGLKTVKGTGFLLSMLYKQFAKRYRVHVFSRRNILPEGFSTRDMAADLNYCLNKLSLNKINLLGISQGGMISQFFAIDYQEKLKKLIIAVSLSRPNATSRQVIKSWYDMAKRKQFKALTIDTMEKTYVGKRLKKYRWVYPFAGLIGKPKSVNRFLIQANACLYHNAYDELNTITVDTLVVGGLKDKIVGSKAAAEMAERIPNSRLIEYPELGHGASDEKVFIEDAIRFLG
jgi:pimeloyl-ACP methyl ester carboxylesterase